MRTEPVGDQYLTIENANSRARTAQLIQQSSVPRIAIFGYLLAPPDKKVAAQLVCYFQLRGKYLVLRVSDEMSRVLNRHKLPEAQGS